MVFFFVLSGFSFYYYVAVAVLKLVAGVRGFYPARICDEITWNRVANLKGGAGNNLALDLVNEFLNNEFKGTKLYVVTSRLLLFLC